MVKYRCQLGQERLVTWALKPLAEVSKMRVATAKCVQVCTAVCPLQHQRTSVTRSAVFFLSGFPFELHTVFFFLNWASWNLVTSCQQRCRKISGVTGCQFRFSSSLVTGSPKMVNKACFWSDFRSVLLLVWYMLTSYLDMSILPISYWLSATLWVNKSMTQTDEEKINL